MKSKAYNLIPNVTLYFVGHSIKTVTIKGVLFMLK